MERKYLSKNKATGKNPIEKKFQIKTPKTELRLVLTAHTINAFTTHLQTSSYQLNVMLQHLQCLSKLSNEMTEIQRD